MLYWPAHTHLKPQRDPVAISAVRIGTAEFVKSGNLVAWGATLYLKQMSRCRINSPGNFFLSGSNLLFTEFLNSLEGADLSSGNCMCSQPLHLLGEACRSVCVYIFINVMSLDHLIISTPLNVFIPYIRSRTEKEEKTQTSEVKGWIALKCLFLGQVHTPITQARTEIHFPKTLHHSHIQVTFK